MKQLNSYLKLLILLKVIAFMTISCQKEDDTISTKLTLDENPALKITIVPWENIEIINKTLQSKVAKFNNVKAIQRTESSTNHNFSIDNEQVQIIEDINFTTYTFLAYSDIPNPNILLNYTFKANIDGTYEQYLLKYHYTINNHGEIIYDTEVAEIEFIFDENLVFNRTGCVPEFVEVLDDIVCTNHSTCTGAANHTSPNDPQCDCEDTPQTCYKAGTSVCELQYVFVYQGCGGGGDDIPDPDNPDNTTGGGGPHGGNNNNNNNSGFHIVPLINVGQQIVTLLEIPTLGPNAQLDLYNWIMNRNNSLIIAEIYAFLLENGFSDEAIEEAKMRIEVEFVNDSTDPKWNTSETGTFSGIEALQYDATYTLPGYNGQRKMYRLINPNRPEFNHKQVLFKSNTAHNINGQYNQTIASSEIPLDGNYHYLYNVDTESWYEYGLPVVTVDCLSCDLNNFFKSVIENSLVVTGRYFLPVEDMLILLSGEDFYGVEQSRAVAGGFLLLEMIPGAKAIKLLKGVKYADEIVSIAEVTYKFVDEIYTSQKQTVKEVLDGVIDLDAFGNTIRKGNFGEMVTDTDLFSKGYEPLHVRRTNIDEPLSTGIDGVFKNPQNNEYIIVESKYNTSSLNQLTNNGPQMSDSWIQGSNRLANEVGQDLADEILDEGYTRVLARVLPDGTIIYKELNSAGQVIGNWTP
jgi:hypothetical protein